jgi:hypothetical protein
MKPEARRDGLVVKEVADEVLVYDLEAHRAHCLNRTAAVVFKHCDGRTSVAQIANHVRREMDAPADEAVVWLALDQIEKAGLLQERVVPRSGPARYSRREVMRRVGVAGGLAVLVPMVTSILAPTPVEAAATCVNDCSGQTNGTPCSLTAPSNCFCTCNANVCEGGC